MATDKERYMIDLPAVNLGIPAFGNVPQRAIVYAHSPAEAVAAHIMKYARGAGQRIINRLGADYSGIGNLAFDFPFINEDSEGEPLDRRTRSLADPYILGNAIAEKRGQEFTPAHVRYADVLLAAAA